MKIRNLKHYGVLCALCLAAASVFAAGEPDAEAVPAEPQVGADETGESPIDIQRRVAGIMTAFSEQVRARDWTQAAELCRQGVKLLPDDPLFHYNLACCLSLTGDTDGAFDALELAVRHGWDDPRHLGADPDLDSLRDDPRYAQLVAGTEANRIKSLGKYEEGVVIEGVRTVEGNPANGLRWRLRMSPDADKDAPDRLLIWLHPSGGSMNRQVESLSRRIMDAGYGLLVLTQKSFRGWGEEDTGRLMSATLTDVADVEGIDIGKPVLLGYSAGGQAALRMYSQTPGLFGGLVLIAAYPVTMSDSGGYEVLPPPEQPAASGVPLLVFVGKQDGGAHGSEYGKEMTNMSATETGVAFHNVVEREDATEGVRGTYLRPIVGTDK